MGFFENTRKPQGFGGRIMVKMMNTGHSKLAKWGFTKIYTKLDSKVLDIGCGGGANIVNWIKIYRLKRRNTINSLIIKRHRRYIAINNITPALLDCDSI